MVTATLLALSAAVIHAGWNLAIKVGGDDRYLLLWGQFFLAGLLCAPVVVWVGMPARSWIWVAISGAVHLPYCVFLAKAYDLAEFSLVYPIARGAGAMFAAVGGILFLKDRLSLLSSLGIGTVGLGLVLLATGGNRASVAMAMIVACTIGVYSVSDTKGIRASPWVFALATHIGTASTNTAYGLVTGQYQEMKRVLQTHWPRLAAAGAASSFTYLLVLLANKKAPVGYVSALRECSVLLAALYGWLRLRERVGRRRLAATAIVVLGLVLVIAGRNR